MARIVLIRHGYEREDDRVVTFCRYNGVEPEILRPFAGDDLGHIDDVVASVIYGGNFNTYDEKEHPFLYKENLWIEKCLKKDIPLIGICQGAQSIARVLGAEVGPKNNEPYEFGYYELTATEAGKAYFPEKFHMPEAHYHEFQTPKDAINLAYSDLFGQQAFKYGDHVFGFQFHPEISPASFHDWQEEKKQAYNSLGAQSRETQDKLMAKHNLTIHHWFMDFQEKLFGNAISAVLA